MFLQRRHKGGQRHKKRSSTSLIMKAKVLVAQSCPTLCNFKDCGLAGSSVHGILRARIMEWAAISFSRRSSRHMDRFWVSCIVGGFFTNWATREWEKCKSKLQWGITSHWSEWPSFKSWIINAGKGVEEKESSYTIAEVVNWCSYYREQYGNSSKN